MSDNPYMDIKIGDTIVVDTSRYGRTNSYSTMVSRITATQIVTSDHSVRFRRKDGYIVGADPWDNRHIIVDPSRIARLQQLQRRQKAEEGLRGLKLTRASVETLRDAAAVAETFLREIGEWEKTDV